MWMTEEGSEMTCEILLLHAEFPAPRVGLFTARSGLTFSVAGGTHSRGLIICYDMMIAREITASDELSSKHWFLAWRGGSILGKEGGKLHGIEGLVPTDNSRSYFRVSIIDGDSSAGK